MNKLFEWHDYFRSTPTYKALSEKPVAYFCMEYALPKNLPIYAGGLGVLAGDYVTEAGEQHFPMVAIGLFYSKKSQMSISGVTYPDSNPEDFPITPVNDSNGERLKITLPIEGRTVAIQVWLYQEGTIPVYLLDTNLPDNDPIDRAITELLYVVDRSTRLKQEMVLGIGGVRLLEQLGIKPSIYHMNEGHSALLAFETSRIIMERDRISFADAFTQVKKHISFTNHTLVLGGHDIFDADLARSILSAYAAEIGTPIETLIEKGIDPNDQGGFSMTFLALESASFVNAVSVLHGEVAKDVWPDRNMAPITNGVNIHRWDKVSDTEKLSERHQENKRKLINLVKEQTGVEWGENDLIVGWARRIVEYKRPTSFFANFAASQRLLSNPDRPIRLVFSGHPHYSDGGGLRLVGELRSLASTQLWGKMVFLDKYSTAISDIMVAGSDIWLNTPVVGLEACGTSGMKAALNGTIPCSTNDGWLPEINLVDVGFMLDSNDITNSVLYTFEHMIVPMYYEGRQQSGSPWQQKMKLARETILDNFGTDRMLKDYIEKMYVPLVGNN